MTSLGRILKTTDIGPLVVTPSAVSGMFIFQLYIAEISPAKYRGTLGSANQLGVTFGGLLAYSLGAGLNRHWLAIAAAVPTTVMAILMLRFPETPRWLIKNDRTNEARRALAFLRKTSEDECEDECREIQGSLGKFYFSGFVFFSISEKQFSI
jgi:MFS family permease